MTGGRLAALSLLVGVGALAAYVLLFRVALVRNHPEGYLAAFALATGLAGLALWRSRRWSSWVALTVSGLLLVGGLWLNAVVARVPDAPVGFRVGQPAPEFTLPDAGGRPVSLQDYRGRRPVILVFYRGYW